MHSQLSILRHPVLFGACPSITTTVYGQLLADSISPWTQYSPWGLAQDPNQILYPEDPYDPDPYL